MTEKTAQSYGQSATGDGSLLDGSMISGVAENLKFRITSVRDMLMGDMSRPETTPIKRRMVLMRRRRELLGIGGNADSTTNNTAPSEDDEVNTSVRTTGTTNTSGSISQDLAEGSESSTGTVENKTPSLSEINN